jgi:hypothetical protein
MATSAARMSSKHRTCQGCGKAQDDKAEPFKTCAACKRSRYCSEICQRADWANHKTKCLQLRAAKAAQCEFDKWVEAGNRLEMLTRLYAHEVPAAPRVCDQLCLHVMVKVDASPDLDGYRIVGHNTGPVSELSSSSYSFPVSYRKIMADRPPLLPELVQAPIAIHLLIPRLDGPAGISLFAPLSRLRVFSVPSDVWASQLHAQSADEICQKIIEHV